MANSYLQQFFYTKHHYPVLLDASWVVNAADTGGLGITGLKGAGIANVYMHTSQTPATGNPNPAAGEIMVQLRDSYAAYLGMWADFGSPLVGSPSTSSTTNVINVITTLGSATTAQWQAVGLPAGITPAVNVAFVGTASAVIGGSAQVDLRKVAGAGIDHIELVGDIIGSPNQNLINSTIQNAALAQAAGGYLYFACFKNTALTAPSDGTTINMKIYVSNFSKSTF